MVDRNEVAAKVQVQHDRVSTSLCLADGVQRLVRRALGPDSVATRHEVGLEDRFEHDAGCRLHHPVSQGRDAQRPLFVHLARLRDVHATHGLRSIRILLQCPLARCPPGMGPLRLVPPPGGRSPRPPRPTLGWPSAAVLPYGHAEVTMAEEAHGGRWPRILQSGGSAHDDLVTEALQPTHCGSDNRHLLPLVAVVAPELLVADAVARDIVSELLRTGYIGCIWPPPPVGPRRRMDGFVAKPASRQGGFQACLSKATRSGWGQTPNWRRKGMNRKS